jgi:hypothetical protein
MALDIEHRQHQARRERRGIGAMRLAVHGAQYRQAIVVIGQIAAQPRLHQRVPDRRIVLVIEALRLGNGLLNDSAQLRILLRRARDSRRRECRAEQRQQRGAARQQPRPPAARG